MPFFSHLPVKVAANSWIQRLFLLSFSALSLSASIESKDAVSRANLPRPESFVAYGVDTATGAFTYSVNLMTTMGENPVPFDLIYNSRFADQVQDVAPGWTHPYETRVEGDPEGIMTVFLDAFQQNSFFFQNDTYNPTDLANTHETFFLDNGQRWEWERLDGTRFRYDLNGRLDEIRNKVDQFLNVTFQTDTLLLFDQFNSNRGMLEVNLEASGRVESVEDKNLRKRVLQYDEDGLLVRILNPAETESPLFSSRPKLEIPNGDPAGITDTLTVDDTGPVGYVNLVMRIDDSHKGELEVVLTAPDGTQMTLHNRLGGQSNNLRYDGRAVANFYGIERNGDWTLKVIDYDDLTSGTGPVGSLEDWSLTFSPRVDAMEFTYDDNQRLTRIEWPAGQTLLENTYDAQGRVATQNDGRPDTPAATFTYEPVSGGTRTTYTDRAGAVTRFDHSEDFLLERIEDALGGVTTYQYNADGDRIQQTDTAGREVFFGYTAVGMPAFIEYPDKTRVDFVYDARKNLTEIRDALGQRTNFIYDDANNLEVITDPLQNVTERTYSNNSQLESIRLYAANQELSARFVEFGYADNMVTSALHPATNGSDRSRVTYDRVGRIDSRTDADGFRTRFSYDDQDNMTRQEDPLGNTSTFIYDARGRLVSRTDPRGNTTTFTYDGNDNLVQSTDPLGQSRTFTYDAEDRLLTQTDTAGRISTFTYDALGRRIARETPLGRTTLYEYNAAHEVTSITGPNGNRLETIQYDTMGRVVSQADALGYQSTMEYDVLGRLTRAVDPLGRETDFGYDALSRPDRVVDPLNRLVENTFDSEDVLRSTTDARGNTTEFEYDAANRLAAVRTPDGEETTFLYNFRDLPLEVDFPGPYADAFTYDEAGRLTRHDVLENGNATTGRDYTYDSNGNLLSVEGGNATLSREYDALNRMTAFTDEDGNRIEYAYNTVGFLETLTYPDGKTVTYTYDADDRLTEIVDWAGRSTTYTYDAQSQIRQIRFPNGTMRTIDYDRRGSPILRREIAADGSPIRQFRYIYDTGGQVRAVEGNTVPSFVPGQTQFTYDERNRILSVNGGAVEYNARGQLTQGPLNGQPTEFSYDLHGRLDLAGGNSYGYDNEDRLKFSFENNSRVVRWVTSPHHPLNQVLVQSPQGAEPTYYVYGVGLAYEVRGESIRVYHYDHLGNTVALSGDDGAVVGEIHYSPYGDILATTGETDTPFRFHGLYGVMTMDSGLVFMRFRWFSPELRRFISEDAHLGSIRQIESLNRHAFAHGNPIQFVDPEGEFIQVAIGAVAGAIGGVAAQGISDLITGELSSFEQYAGSAVGGAVTGGLLAATFNPALAGAAGAAAGNLTTQGLNNLSGKQSGFDLSSLAVDTVLGGVGGVIGDKGAKVGSAALKSGKKAGRKVLGKVLGRTIKVARPKAQVFNLTRHPVAYLSAVELASQSAERIGAGAVRAVSSEFILNPLMATVGSFLNPSIAQAPDGSSTHVQVRVKGLNTLRKAPRNIYGEFIHYGDWTDALRISLKPQPNSPNHAPTSF